MFVGELGGGRGEVWAVKKQKVLGGSWGILPREILENLYCPGLHFTRFHGGEKEYRVKGRSKSPGYSLTF